MPIIPTHDYLLRRFPREIWQRARMRALQAQMPLSVVIRALVTRYADGEIDIVRAPPAASLEATHSVDQADF